ncbi:MAG: pyridoxamine 5'-phosphate oxidase family protein [Gammaproteobacteria bacterium]|nr:pyridoxamine 5'-phosphate oxidase family protein [Gammaproteobacteria bacterium]
MSNTDRSFELRGTSAWNLAELESFLDQAVIPLRLGIADRAAPLIVPLWYCYQEGTLWCATHQDAHVVRAVAEQPLCAIDISTNDVPYRGVRGAGSVDVIPERGSEWIEVLVQRYLGGTDSKLAHWLLGRREEEVALRIEPHWLTSWDFSGRMNDLKGSR